MLLVMYAQLLASYGSTTTTSILYYRTSTSVCSSVCYLLSRYVHISDIMISYTRGVVIAVLLLLVVLVLLLLVLSILLVLGCSTVLLCSSTPPHLCYLGQLCYLSCISLHTSTPMLVAVVLHPAGLGICTQYMQQSTTAMLCAMLGVLTADHLTQSGQSYHEIQLVSVIVTPLLWVSGRHATRLQHVSSAGLSLTELGGKPPHACGVYYMAIALRAGSKLYELEVNPSQQ